MNRFFLMSLLPLLLLVPSLGHSQALEADTTRLNRYKAESASLIRFLEFSLNTIADPATSARERDIIIQESYLKMFQSAKVQIEDDLVPDRSAITNKDVQAYLKDVDFFFVKAKFEFSQIHVAHQVNEQGNLYFVVSFLRYLEGITIDGDTIRNSQQRFAELNLDQDSRILKIASIYTTRLGETEELVEWWDNLDQSWKNRWATSLRIRDSLRLSDVMAHRPYVSLRDTILVAKDPQVIEGGEFVGDLSVFDSASKPFSSPETSREHVLGQEAIPVFSPLLLADLKRLINVRSLDFSGEVIYDIEPLGKFTQLRSLNLSGTSVFDLAPLRNLTYLEALDCSKTQVRTLEPLRYATQLKELRLASTRVTQLQTLTRFPALRVLDLSRNLITDIVPLAKLASLKDLDLGQTLLSEVNALAALTELNRLSLAGTQVSDLKPLASLQNLQYLNLEDCPVKQLDHLAGNLSLRLLFVDGTQIRSLLPLAKLPELSRVYCDHTFIGQAEAQTFTRNRPEVLIVFESGLLKGWWDQMGTDWQDLFRGLVPVGEQPTREELQQMANVREVDLRGKTFLSSLAPVEVLVNLRKLNLSGTSIQSLEALQDLTDLELLDCSFSQVSSLEPLTNHSRLTTLIISSTPIVSLAGIEGATDLKTLLADSLQVESLAPLDSLGRLSRVSIEGSSVPREEVIRFLRSHPETITLFQSAYLLTWWEQLPAAWKACFSQIGTVGMTPGPEALHNLTQSTQMAVIDYSAILDIAPMTEFLRLKHFHLQGAMVRDLRPLASLKSLEVLLLPKNPVSDLNPLSGLSQLRHLQLDNTLVNDLSPLQTLGKLQVLSCQGTSVKNLKPLSGLLDLRQLDIASTQVRSLSPLDALPRISWIQCFNTRISTRAVQKFQEKQPNCEVIHY